MSVNFDICNAILFSFYHTLRWAGLAVILINLVGELDIRYVHITLKNTVMWYNHISSVDAVIGR